MSGVYFSGAYTPTQEPSNGSNVEFPLSVESGRKPLIGNGRNGTWGMDGTGRCDANVRRSCGALAFRSACESYSIVRVQGRNTHGFLIADDPGSGRIAACSPSWRLGARRTIELYPSYNEITSRPRSRIGPNAASFKAVAQLPCASIPGGGPVRCGWGRCCRRAASCRIASNGPNVRCSSSTAAGCDGRLSTELLSAMVGKLPLLHQLIRTGSSSGLGLLSIPYRHYGSQRRQEIRLRPSCPKQNGFADRSICHSSLATEMHVRLILVQAAVT